MESEHRKLAEAAALWKRLKGEHSSDEEWPEETQDAFLSLGFDITDENDRFELHDAAFGDDITALTVGAIRKFGAPSELPPPIEDR